MLLMELQLTGIMSATCPLLRRLIVRPLRLPISRLSSQQRCNGSYKMEKVNRREQQDPDSRREALLVSNGEEYPLILRNSEHDGWVFRHKEFVERYDRMLKPGEKREDEKVTIRGALLGMCTVSRSI